MEEAMSQLAQRLQALETNVEEYKAASAAMSTELAVGFMLRIDLVAGAKMNARGVVDALTGTMPRTRDGVKIYHRPGDGAILFQGEFDRTHLITMHDTLCAVMRHAMGQRICIQPIDENITPTTPGYEAYTTADVNAAALNTH